MQNYALLHMQTGLLQNSSLVSGMFEYPLKTDQERARYRRALEHITEHKSQQHTRWTLVTEDKYEEALRICREISEVQRDPITLPQGIGHGNLHFNVYFRFDGYTVAEKDLLIARLFEFGIRPRHEALDFMYTHKFKELDT